MTKDSEQWVCVNCGYVYDPVEGDPVGHIAPGTPFQDIPDTWQCPICYASKDRFDPL